MLKREIVSFRFVRSCVCAVWLPSGIGSQKLLAGLFPFLFGPGELSLFPFGDDELSLFPSQTGCLLLVRLNISVSVSVSVYVSVHVSVYDLYLYLYMYL